MKKRHLKRKFEYVTASGEVRSAVCTRIEFHPLLKRPVFHGISPFGNAVKLSADEIRRWCH